MWTLTVALPITVVLAGRRSASLMIAVPTLLIFILCQKVIIQGIVVPTEKNSLTYGLPSMIPAELKKKMNPMLMKVIVASVLVHVVGFYRGSCMITTVIQDDAQFEVRHQSSKKIRR